MIKAGIRNELTKLLSLKKYKALLLLTCLFSILAGLLGRAAQGVLSLLTTNTPITVLSIATEFLLPLIIFMATADLFTAEQENGTIKAVITRPVGRMGIFISKVLGIYIYTFLILLVCFVTSLIWSIVFNGIGLSKVAEILLSYAVSIIPILPVIFFAVTISQLCKSSSSTVMLSVLGYLIIVAAGIVLPKINPMLFTTYTNWYKLFIGAAMPIANIFNVVVLLVAYSLILFAVSSWAFEGKEY
jgi:ABC-2 type transport system permease protein